MDYRSLGASGLNVPVLGLGTANFRAEASPAEGIGERTAARLVDVAIERGAAFFDTANTYASSEELLGKILAKRRSQVLLATKAGLRSGSTPNDTGATRHHLIEACERSLKRLGTDYIDLFQIHSFDGRTPVEETLATLDGLIRSGKVRYIGCSNYAGWQLMKSLAAADRNGWPRFVSHQIAYSLAVRDCEWELAPLAADQNVASLVWGPLAGGALSGKYSRAGTPLSAIPRPSSALAALPESQLYDIIACLGDVAKETGASQAQIALAWLLQRPTVATLFVGATTPEQFEASLDALELRLTGDQVARLDEASARPAPYPHALQRGAGAERLIRPLASGNVRVDKALGGGNIPG
jgi:aryl-alcohol dehydrogenase-like predicted oxidoreductase